MDTGTKGPLPAAIVKTVKALLFLMAVVLVLYHGATVWTSFHGAMKHYTVHVTGALFFASLWLILSGNEESHSAWSRWAHIITGVVAAVLSVTTGYYLYENAETLEITQPFVNDTTILIGLLLVFTVLIVAWRIWGAPIAIICLGAALYLMFGHMLPEPFGARQQPLNVAVSFLGGIGGPRGVLNYAPLSADMIFLLLVYGGLLHGTKVISMFGALGAAIGNVLRGGVAYSAIVASTLIGMVTGQAVSNIALSGVMTIPTMKQNGFNSNEAGAIEVMASTGSQLLPPIMGLGAFLMAVILGVSYIDIVIAGLIPGLLYMLAIAISLNSLIGSKVDLANKKEDVDWGKIKWVLPSFLISFTVLIVLLVMRFSPPMAGFWGGIIILVLSFARPARFRPSFDEIRDGFVTGIMTAVQLVVILAAIGIVVQTLTTTGLGVSAGSLISQVSRDSVLIALAIGMAVSLIVGMGLPTPAAYALIAIIVVPSLIDAGLEPLTANMYGFYFAIFSALTPPVAVGILVAVRISGGSFMASAWEAAKLGGLALLIPFLFVSFPTLLSPFDMTVEAVVAIGIYISSAFMIGGALYGAFSRPLTFKERLLFGITAPVCLLFYLASHNVWIGLIPMMVLVLRLVMRKKVGPASQVAQ